MLKSRWVPAYPYSAEREYRRIWRAYIDVVNKCVKKNMPEIIRLYKEDLGGRSRKDGMLDFMVFMHDRLSRMSSEIYAAISNFDLRNKIEKISRIVQRRAIYEWKRAVKKTFGIDVEEKYYRSVPYEQTIQKWLADNISYMGSVTAKFLFDIERIIREGYRNSTAVDSVRSGIQKKQMSIRGKTLFIVRDQVSSLNGKLTRMIQEDSGVTRYVWLSERDDRVRDSHREFDGNIYSWDNPPEDWNMTKKSGIVYTGERYNPGEAPGCRCCGIPVFDLETIKIPLKKEKK